MTELIAAQGSWRPTLKIQWNIVIGKYENQNAMGHIWTSHKNENSKAMCKQSPVKLWHKVQLPYCVWRAQIWPKQTTRRRIIKQRPIKDKTIAIYSLDTWKLSKIHNYPTSLRLDPSPIQASANFIKWSLTTCPLQICIHQLLHQTSMLQMHQGTA